MIKKRRCLWLADLYEGKILVLKMDKLMSKYNQYKEQINPNFDLEKILTQREQDCWIVIHEDTYKKIEQGKGEHYTHEAIFLYIKENAKEFFDYLVVLGDEKDSKATCYLIDIAGITVPKRFYHKKFTSAEKMKLDLTTKGMITICGNSLKDLDNGLVTYILKKVEDDECKKGGR